MISQQTQDIKHSIVTALREDKARDDITSEACLPEDAIVKAEIVLKQNAKIAGLPFIPWVFEAVDPEIKFEIFYSEGAELNAGTTLATLKGKARSLLSGERVALNILQHASGIATITSEYVKEVSEFSCDILDTRKTLPGLRSLQKYAVKMGGGKNHRFNLQEAFLIKNNHIKILKKFHDDAITEAIARARQLQPQAKIEIEVEDLEMLKEALAAKADLILLDNMSTEMMRECVILNNKSAYLEASGGMTKLRLKETAATGIDGISIGALTHSVSAVDISLRIMS
ncbi:MAG: carboxylating nicotinate-nucleotide diphosphorylase [Chlamydiae bacterium]|nr:carboxylating nicotinate-nucleotide diphosphorylase [Chlamydiota bacterium]